VPSDCFKTLMHSFVTSCVDYCHSLYFGLQGHKIGKLNNISTAAAQCVLYRRRSESSMQAMPDLYWLPVDARIKFKIESFAFKAFHKLSPEYFSTHIFSESARNNPRSAYKNNSIFSLQKLKKAYAERFFLLRGCQSVEWLACGNPQYKRIYHFQIQPKNLFRLTQRLRRCLVHQHLILTTTF